MKETFIILFSAHLAGDFLFQNSRMVRDKEVSFLRLIQHAAVVGLSTLVLAAYFKTSWALLICLWVVLAHFVIDWMKAVFGRDDATTLILDQIAHIIALIVIAYLLPHVGANSLWLKLFPASWFCGLTFFSGFVACVFVGGILISKATKPLVQQIDANQLSGLKNGGRYIGQLERALTFFFMLTGQTNAVGFLFAAKSILRFGEIKEPEKRKEAEYIIIGTFMSFGWALLTAYLTIKAMAMCRRSPLG